MSQTRKMVFVVTDSPYIILMFIIRSFLHWPNSVGRRMINTGNKPKGQKRVYINLHKEKSVNS